MERLTFVAKCSEGAYGTVWKCVDKATGAICAVKKMKDAPRNKEVSRGMGTQAICRRYDRIDA